MERSMVKSSSIIGHTSLPCICSLGNVDILTQITYYIYKKHILFIETFAKDKKNPR